MIERGRRILKNVRLTLQLAWRAAPRQMGVVIGLTVVTAVIGPLTLLATGKLIDGIASRPSTWQAPVVLWPALGLGALALANLALQSFISRVHDVFSDRVWLAAHKSFLAHVAAADMALLDDTAWHDKLARARRDVGWRPYNLNVTLIHVFSSTITLLSLGSALVVLDPPLLLFAFVAVAPAGLLRMKSNKTLYDYAWTTTNREREHDYMVNVATSPSFAKDVRAFGLGVHVVDRAKDLSLDRIAHKSRLYRDANTRDLFGGIATALILVVAYLFIVDAGTHGTLTIGSIAAIFGAFTSVSANLAAMFQSLITVDQHAQFLDDYFTFMSITPSIASPARPRALPAHITRVVVDDVSFRYPAHNEERGALSNVSLDLRAGKIIALVGENGAGKSTLVKLLLRFFDPSGGAVRAGDDTSLVDVREVDPFALREKIGVLFQDYGAYELAVKDVLRFGRVNVPFDEQRALAALKAARAEPIVDEIGHGLSSVVGRLFEGGHDLSGGQWQRLALARLIYRDADLWILDEPTANLDPAAEAEIFDELRTLLAGRMGIVISHRFSTVRTADEIVVLANGAVVERGTHDALMEKQGRYAEMFALQAKGYR